MLGSRSRDVFGLTKGNRGIRQAQVLKVQKGGEVRVYQREQAVCIRKTPLSFRTLPSLDLSPPTTSRHFLT